MELEPGVYRLPDLKDDGAIIVERDGITLDFLGVTLDEAAVDVEAGEHEVRIEYFEIDGYAQLQFTIEPPA
ncbi:MAG: hypothetical protein V1790_06075 [Planctomycetota bacterium]